MKLSNAQQRALDLVKERGVVCAGCGGGVRRATLCKLRDLGLVVIETRTHRESVPAGPFGRTARYGYKTVTWIEVCARIAE